jgi:hypothetical protein
MLNSDMRQAALQRLLEQEAAGKVKVGAHDVREIEQKHRAIDDRAELLAKVLHVPVAWFTDPDLERVVNPPDPTETIQRLLAAHFDRVDARLASAAENRDLQIRRVQNDLAAVRERDAEFEKLLRQLNLSMAALAAAQKTQTEALEHLRRQQGNGGS